MRPNDLGPLVTQFIEDSFRFRMDEDQTVTLIHLGIDASGDVDSDRFIAYGIVAAYPNSWVAFHKHWAKFLAKHGVPYLRMTEAMRWQGPFARKRSEWGKDRDIRRERLLKEAARLIVKYLGPNASAMKFGGLPPQHKRFKWRKSTMFVGLVAHLIEETPSESALVFICDDEQDVAKEYYDFLNRLKRQQQGLAHRIGGICFMNDKRIGQIQAADMVAYVFRQHMEGITSALYPILFKGMEQVMKKDMAFIFSSELRA